MTKKAVELLEMTVPRTYTNTSHKEIKHLSKLRQKDW